MVKFPRDVPIRRAIKTMELLGFVTVREGNHISMIRENADGTTTPLTMPNHKRVKGIILRVICRESGISREEFLEAYRKA